MDSINAEQITRIEQVTVGKWIRPCARTEKYEKLKPIVTRSYQLPSGEIADIHFKDINTPPNVIATPRRKSVEVLIKGTHDNKHYEVSARFGNNPSMVFGGVPDPAPKALSFESWEPENPARDIRPSPFTCTSMDMDEVEIKFNITKL